MGEHSTPAKPVKKITAAGVGGAAAILVVWGLGLAGVDVPPEVAASLSTIAAFGAGYLKSA